MKDSTLHTILACTSSRGSSADAARNGKQLTIHVRRAGLDVLILRLIVGIRGGGAERQFITACERWLP